MSIRSNFPTLHVEGKNDQFVIANLLARHGVDMSDGKRPLNIKPPKDAPAKGAGVEALLGTMPEAILAAYEQPLGFVLDADVAVAKRWSAVVRQLKRAGLEPPAVCPADGYIDQLAGYPHSIGVWMMPDCVTDHGKLEHLLKTLVPAADPLWPHAEASPREALRRGASFTDSDFDKAWLHCWLSWQAEPGVPYGTAINAKFLQHDSTVALAFLRWLKSLFALHDLSGI